MSSATMNSPVTIDIVSDVICPWCFLGKRRLDKALAGIPEIPVEVRWRPFLLDGSIPREGIPRKQYLEQKFGPERLKTIHDPLKAAGAAEGLPYAFEKITVTPNTLNAHRLLRWAHVEGVQHAMAERLFQLYWMEGQNVGDPPVLAQAAEDCGMKRDVVEQLLKGDADLDFVIDEINMAAELGINSVPTFIVGGRYAVVGAQPPEILKGALVRASLEARQPLQTH